MNDLEQSEFGLPIRWRCPLCGRIDPRHRLTMPSEMPPRHTHVGQSGTPFTDPSILCPGVRVPEKQLSDGTWVKDLTAGMENPNYTKKKP